MKLKFDLAKLTLGDMEDFEEYTGRPLMVVFQGLEADGITAMSAKDLKAFVWICIRAEDPEYTIDDARNLSFAELKDIEVEVPAEDPTPGSEQPS